MNANELRLGNYMSFYSVDDIERVHDITNSSINTIDIDDIKPITLTEEWLLKFGFENDKYGSVKKDFQVKIWKYHSNCYFRTIEEMDGKMGDWYYVGSIKYVHQLQNLYFALTGEELKETKTKKK